ncbi:hypothetical protein Sipo8835_29245 [Streptomyces ipomoeae]|uniref:Uncharacterized protein n=1 Tax=Streptomyces ipomoeae TaxID=103232 RepID=A0AAE9AYL7_9ACTN|nr:hypothetical protein [Streptomyces ipomoeae]TQE26415.1 hypothetical protein Sipo8835_29245 [Streptomyces ipomoeae]
MSHEQFGGLVDGIHEIVNNFQERYGYHPAEQDREGDKPETRRTAFQPHTFGQSGAQPRTSWPSPSAYNNGSLTFADH